MLRTILLLMIVTVFVEPACAQTKKKKLPSSPSQKAVKPPNQAEPMPEPEKEKEAPPADERQDTIDVITRLGGVPTNGPDGTVYSVKFTGIDVTDDAVAVLPALPEIQMVSLVDAEVTDAALRYLSALPNLKTLALHRTLVTQTGVEQFKRDSPNVQVLYLQRPNSRLVNALGGTGLFALFGLLGGALLAVTWRRRAVLSGRLKFRGISMGLLLSVGALVCIAGVWWDYFVKSAQ